MAKVKSSFFCQNCGAESAKWQGKCSSCGEWNTYVEEIRPPSRAKHAVGQTTFSAKPQRIQEVQTQGLPRIPTGLKELDHVLGGGIVPGSLILLGGAPGIGKSTLLLQMAIKTGKKTLYVSGEESPEQIKLRADRVGIASADCFLLGETDLDAILHQCEALRPDQVIIDSIQTIHFSALDAAAGSVSQVKACAGELMKYAKQTHTPIWLIGHINKDGVIAGPKVLEHMVDTVLQFEGDRHLVYRILRSVKNRFGSTSEIGLFEMFGAGLREVENPSEILISPSTEAMSRVAIGATMEGNRPLIIETQALVSPATYGTPQRSPTGYDTKRLNMLLAVLEKRVGIRLSSQDVFLNIAGGLKTQDTSLDIAICAAIFSSFQEAVIPKHICFAGEVGLGGEIRAVNLIEQRLSEAEKLGFTAMFVSKHQRTPFTSDKLKVYRVNQLSQVFSSSAVFD